MGRDHDHGINLGLQGTLPHLPEELLDFGGPQIQAAALFGLLTFTEIPAGNLTLNLLPCLERWPLDRLAKAQPDEQRATSVRLLIFGNLQLQRYSICDYHVGE